MVGKLLKTPHDALTYRVIGCAMAVHRERGPGFKEETYQADLALRLAGAGLSFEAEKSLAVYDGDQGDVLLGYYIPDFIVEDAVVVEIKALKSMDNSHLAQAIGYLAVTGCSVALLLNFGARSLQWRRILPPKDIQQHRINRRWLFVPDWLRGE